MQKEVIIVGTSHIAKESAGKVKNVIEENQPDVVGIELDITRYKALLSQNKPGAKKSSGFYTLRQIGLKGFLFAMIGSFTMKRLAKYIGTNPGVDMLEAAKIAKKNESRVYLIDRHINITLSKFSKALTTREIFRFLWDILKGIFNPRGELKKIGIKRFDLNTIPGEEIVEKMILYMKKRYPSVYDVMVHQRNVYMSKVIIKIMESYDVEKMVAVVGAGHQKGMKKILEREAKSNFHITTL
ncbi:MAG: TraB/GumN family protein [Candidatus Nanoarchaeia archaeon]